MAEKLQNGHFLKGAPQNQYIDAESAYKLKIQAEFPGSKMCKHIAIDFYLWTISYGLKLVLRVYTVEFVKNIPDVN